MCAPCGLIFFLFRLFSTDYQLYYHTHEKLVLVPWAFFKPPGIIIVISFVKLVWVSKQYFFLCYLCDLNHVTSFKPYNDTSIWFVLELNSLVKYLLRLGLLFETSNILSLGWGISKTWLSKRKKLKRKMHIKHQKDG